jgi:hypothetical protein
VIALNTAFFLETLHPGRLPRASGRGPAGGTIMGTNHRDLCSTCSYASACIHRSAPHKRVFQCEEFCAERPLPPMLPESLPKPAHQAPIGTALLKGLCSDCQNREHCALQLSEGGVWHCEEYC